MQTLKSGMWLLMKKFVLWLKKSRILALFLGALFVFSNLTTVFADGFVYPKSGQKRHGYAFTDDKYIHEYGKRKDSGYMVTDNYIHLCDKRKDSGYRVTDGYIHLSNKSKSSGFRISGVDTSKLIVDGTVSKAIVAFIAHVLLPQNNSSTSSSSSSSSKSRSKSALDSDNSDEDTSKPDSDSEDEPLEVKKSKSCIYKSVIYLKGDLKSLRWCYEEYGYGEDSYIYPCGGTKSEGYICSSHYPSCHIYPYGTSENQGWCCKNNNYYPCGDDDSDSRKFSVYGVEYSQIEVITESDDPNAVAPSIQKVAFVAHILLNQGLSSSGSKPHYISKNSD